MDPNNMETLGGSFYDYPQYYDLVYGSDWKAEVDFLVGCFSKHGTGRTCRLFEPACGTGRLMFRLARHGYHVSGLDQSEPAVRYCNQRLERHGLGPGRAFVGRMEEFHLRRPVDAAYNMINSFRHLADERSAERHLECVARALRPGGLYVMGLHLTPAGRRALPRESWSARRGNLGIITHMKSLGQDGRRRRERFTITYDIYTPTRRRQLTEDLLFRTYTARQITRMISGVSSLALIASYDFAYNLGAPHPLGPASEDVVLVLKRA